MSNSQDRTPRSRLSARMGAIPGKLLRAVLKKVYRPALVPVEHKHELLRMGTAYGGWSFVNCGNLHGATIVSCGLGEDASFDVQFAKKFNARVLLVDPTPKAVLHHEALEKRLGRAATAPYARGGKQPVEAYDLSGLAARHLELVDKALWTEATTLKFYSPPDPSHVSHSIVDFQNDYSKSSRFIEVQSTTLGLLMSEFGLERIPLIKLDIEGAEIEVLLDMMKRQIFPDQILVEYDELARPSRRSRDRIDACHRELLRCGYDLIHCDEPTNFLYWRRDAASA